MRPSCRRRYRWTSCRRRCRCRRCTGSSATPPPRATGTATGTHLPPAGPTRCCNGSAASCRSARTPSGGGRLLAEKQLRDLDGAERRTRAEVVGGDEQRQSVVRRRVTSDPAHVARVLPRGEQRRGNVGEGDARRSGEEL